MSDRRDTIYAHPAGELSAFTFDKRVVDVFPDMISRSVPGYNTIIGMTGLLAGRYASAGSRCYDLGCSLGASTLSMRRHITSSDCSIVGVDNSKAMLSRCAELVEEDEQSTPVTLLCQNIEDTVIDNASVVVLNFTLQFVPLEQRDELIRGIFAGLKPGGIVILSEKVLFADPALDALNIELHHQFKAANGYSQLEIAQKRSALENVLIPETLVQHKQRMTAAGFRSCDVWFQCFNFASMIALK